MALDKPFQRSVPSTPSRHVLDQINSLITSSGLEDFDPPSIAYCCEDDDATIVRLTNITTPKDRTRIDPERALAILTGISEGVVLPPVEVTVGALDGCRPFTLHDGFHRYHISAALGFTHIPVIVVSL